MVGPAQGAVPPSAHRLLYGDRLTPEATLELVGRFHADAIHPYLPSIDETIVQACHENGVEINAWTINSPEDIQPGHRPGDRRHYHRRAGQGGGKPWSETDPLPFRGSGVPILVLTVKKRMLPGGSILLLCSVTGW